VSDLLLPFLFEGGDVRGAVVDLDAAWCEVLKRHAYPLEVRSLLGQAMAAAALLSSTLKFEGTLVLQTRAEDVNAPVRLMVVECNADLSMRATAKLGAAFSAAGSSAVMDGGQAGNTPGGEARDLADLVGAGKLVITLDPHEDGKSAYQGVVPLEGDYLGAALENYMLRSEQLETRIFLAADENRAAGLLIQKMPAEGGHAKRGGVASAADATRVESAATSRWTDAEALASTITSQELLMLEPRDILHRLFHEFDLRVFDARPVAFKCTCSRERVAGMLSALGREEVESILEEQGAVTVNCEFCNLAHAFDPIDAAQLFTHSASAPSAASDARH
jgi:molecular chaperone Hsp33